MGKEYKGLLKNFNVVAAVCCVYYDYYYNFGWSKKRFHKYAKCWLRFFVLRQHHQYYVCILYVCSSLTTALCTNGTENNSKIVFFGFVSLSYFVCLYCCCQFSFFSVASSHFCVFRGDRMQIFFLEFRDRNKKLKCMK